VTSRAKCQRHAQSFSPSLLEELRHAVEEATGRDGAEYQAGDWPHGPDTAGEPNFGRSFSHATAVKTWDPHKAYPSSEEGRALPWCEPPNCRRPSRFRRHALALFQGQQGRQRDSRPKDDYDADGELMKPSSPLRLMGSQLQCSESGSTASFSLTNIALCRRADRWRRDRKRRSSCRMKIGKVFLHTA
jgi:hypothetical protein